MAKHKFLERVFIQLFNDDDGDNASDNSGQDSDKGGGDQQQEQPKEVKMTQAEYDKSLQKRLDRGKKSWEKELHESDDYKNYQSYLDNKKTDDEKVQEQLKGIDTLKETNAGLISKIQAYEQKDLLTKADVDAEFSEFVQHKVLQAMKNDDTDFETALEAIKSDDSNAKYFGSQSNDTSNKRQGQRHKGKGGSDGSNAASLVEKMYGGK